jgi:hypothetical protein
VGLSVGDSRAAARQAAGKGDTLDDDDLGDERCPNDSRPHRPIER